MLGGDRHQGLVIELRERAERTEDGVRVESGAGSIAGRDGDEGTANGSNLVIVTGACTWTAASDVDWITITSATSGIGNGLVQFVAAPNNGPARTGTLTIGGRRYQVSEAGR